MTRRDFIVAACALTMVSCSAAVPHRPPVAYTGRATERATVPQEIEVFYRGEQAFARRGPEEWSLGDVRREEMHFSPDGRRYAYLRSKDPAEVQSAHVLIRNLDGNPVNDFVTYRPGMPQALSWIDNRHIAYVSPADTSRERRKSSIFVVHDAETGEVLSARSGSGFVWNQDRRHVAFFSGAPGRQTLVVDGKTVWPRSGVTRGHGAPVWSPDGHGLALIDETATGPRLVVLVEYEDAAGDLTWNIPREALGEGLQLFWAGDSKVVIGEKALQPKFSAGWERLR